jgi:hypothetical protein
MEINVSIDIGRLFDKEECELKIKHLQYVIKLIENEKENIKTRKDQWESEMKELHDFKKKDQLEKAKEKKKGKKQVEQESKEQDEEK